MDLLFRTENEEGKSDRMTNLKEALFDIFAGHNRKPPLLDYIGMVDDQLSTTLTNVPFLDFDIIACNIPKL